jgi:hypothetical protein
LPIGTHLAAHVPHLAAHVPHLAVQVPHLLEDPAADGIGNTAVLSVSHEST